MLVAYLHLYRTNTVSTYNSLFPAVKQQRT